MDSEDMFLENHLPPAEKFYSQLTGQPISDSDYNHAKHVWEHFGMNNLGDYHDLYLKTDVVLLADVYKNIRNVCNKHNKLDRAHYFTVSGLFWDAMLKQTKVALAAH